MHPLSLTLILPLCFLLASCSRQHLPPIKDLTTIQKDCALLYQQFSVSETPTNGPDFDYQKSLGIRIIPKNKWPNSVLGLNPYMVCTYQGGIQVWIALSRHDDSQAYYIAVNPESTPPSYISSNGFIFKNTSYKGIYEVKQKFESAEKSTN